MTDERAQIKQALLRIGLGQDDLSGRERASRVSALRRVEMMTRPADRPDAEPIQTTSDYPVDPEGRFDPSASPDWWPLRLNWRWTPGSAREAEAIERWRHSTDRAQMGVGRAAVVAERMGARPICLDACARRLEG
jgi:hypothetical protein